MTRAGYSTKTLHDDFMTRVQNAVAAAADRLQVQIDL